MSEYIAFAAFTFACVMGGAMIGFRKGYRQATKEAVSWIEGGGIKRALEDGYQRYREQVLSGLASDPLLDRQGEEGV